MIIFINIFVIRSGGYIKPISISKRLINYFSLRHYITKHLKDILPTAAELLFRTFFIYVLGLE